MDEISASFELISHPDRTLKTHLDSCNNLSKNALALKYINANAFFPRDLIERMRHLLVYYHDFGKASFFQYKIIQATLSAKNNTDFKSLPHIQSYIQHFNANKSANYEKLLDENDRLGNHAKLGAYLVLSNFEYQDPILELILLKIIRRHHGNLTNFFKDVNNNPQILLQESDITFLEKQLEYHDLESYQKIIIPQGLSIEKQAWPIIREKLSNSRKLSRLQATFENQEDVKYFFLQHFLFSLLLAADKGDMMIADGHQSKIILENTLLPIDLINNYKTWRHKGDTPKDIDHIREEAYRTVEANAISFSDQGFFSITLPTGLGKTYAAFNTAVILQNRYYDQFAVKPRIIYVLPFTSIIDQNENIFKEILKNSQIPNLATRLSKNHYLSNANDRFDSQELNKDEPEYLTDGWEHDFIVTTFVQFLESIFTDKNRLLRKFHNMTNAIFVLDEVQSIPPEYFEIIELVFTKMNEYFGTKFVFVTATQPYLFENKTSIQELGNPHQFFQSLNRITLDLSLLRSHDKLEVTEFIQILLEDITEHPDKSFLIICNTIKSSQEIHEVLARSFDNVLYLSSSILPSKRLEVINKIKQALARQIVISTQVVEAGVDIDLDIVYRDFAPLDSINQSAGRCNRNGLKGNGLVKLFNLDKGKYIYDQILLSTTFDTLEPYPNLIQESELFNLNVEYAQSIRRVKATANDHSDYLKKALQELRTEDISAKFKLIEQDYRNYNVFIPIDDTARHIWAQYQEIIRTTVESFELKHKIKKIRPALLQYVTRFPKDKFVPPTNQKDKSIMIIENWEEYYSLETGFKLIEDQTIIL
ncbi:CRISPR-associated helicase/endonuclease Cas3 [Dyadobacter tibetensis]|uniref:CRISPR-associated helicase/endonuclease Cas3 n=1 Tax=Dyadobacter tibetensis TaxID=1211851 RepID=UPI000471AC62|nr:CRISPR-associated helicase/endonuclease Cas3 [Dyadobacter tibetensis]